MKCDICKYKDNCKPKADEPLLVGCTSGRPKKFVDLESTWVNCPICGAATGIKNRHDTEAKNLIVFFHKCKRESIMDIKDMESKVVEV